MKQEVKAALFVNMEMQTAKKNAKHVDVVKK
jgi:hypothetical protein